MADQFDHASEVEALFLRAALSNVQSCNVKPIGNCHYCGEHLKPNELFCDSYCRDDWQEEQRLRKIRGD